MDTFIIMRYDHDAQDGFSDEGTPVFVTFNKTKCQEKLDELENHGSDMKKHYVVILPFEG